MEKNVNSKQTDSNATIRSAEREALLESFVLLKQRAASRDSEN